MADITSIHLNIIGLSFILLGAISTSVNSIKSMTNNYIFNNGEKVPPKIIMKKLFKDRGLILVLIGTVIQLISYFI